MYELMNAWQETLLQAIEVQKKAEHCLDVLLWEGMPGLNGHRGPQPPPDVLIPPKSTDSRGIKGAASD